MSYMSYITSSAGFGVALHVDGRGTIVGNSWVLVVLLLAPMIDTRKWLLKTEGLGMDVSVES